MAPLELPTEDDTAISAISLDTCAAVTLSEELCGVDCMGDLEFAAIECILSDWEHTSAVAAITTAAAHAHADDSIERCQHHGSDGDTMAGAPLTRTTIDPQPPTSAVGAADISIPIAQLSPLAADTASQAPDRQQHQRARDGKRPLRPRASNTSRARQLREMQSLRAQIAALTDALARSQQQQQCQRRLAASWTPASTPHRQLQELELIASRERCEAERERVARARRVNQRLRRNVCDEMRLVERLERAVKKRTARAAALVAEHALLQRRCNGVPRRHMSSGLTPDDQRIFARTLADIAAMYASADRELAALLQHTERLACAPLDNRSGSSGNSAWHVLCDAAHAPAAPTRVEMVAGEEVPFCKAAVDHCLRLTRWQKRPAERLFGVEHYSGLTDVVVTKERVCFGASDSVAHLASHAFVDRDRSIYVGVAYISPCDDSADAAARDRNRTIPRGCVLRAQSWIVLTPRERSTLVHTFASMTPVAADSVRETAGTHGAAAVDTRGVVGKRPAAARAFAPGSAHRVLSEWTRIHAARQQCLENLLLDHQATV